MYAVRNCQWMPFWAALRASTHAVTYAGTEPGASERSIPVSALWSQLPHAGRKHHLYAPGQAMHLGGRKRPVQRCVGMGVQIAADQDPALSLAVARMIRNGLHLVYPVHARVPLAQRNIQRVQGPRRTYS